MLPWLVLTKVLPDWGFYTRLEDNRLASKLQEALTVEITPPSGWRESDGDLLSLQCDQLCSKKADINSPLRALATNLRTMSPCFGILKREYIPHTSQFIGKRLKQQGGEYVQGYLINDVFKSLFLNNILEFALMNSHYKGAQNITIKSC